MLHDVIGSDLAVTAVVYNDEHAGYARVASARPTQRQVRHQDGYPVDQTSDGEKATHINGIESMWARLETWVYLFCGVMRAYLYQYVAMFVQAENHDRITDDLMRHESQSFKFDKSVVWGEFT